MRWIIRGWPGSAVGPEHSQAIHGSAVGPEQIAPRLGGGVLVRLAVQRTPKFCSLCAAKETDVFGANGGSRLSMDGSGHRWMAWPPPLK